ncbi:MAG: SDR family oxidoreductase [Blastocatellia bacterium]
MNVADSTTKTPGSTQRILLAGATGYIGGRLLKTLESAGNSVRCVARHPEFLRSKVGSETEVVAGDVLDPGTLTGAFHGIETAYYLVHSMGSAGDFEEEDRRAAQNFGAAAREAGVRRIIYLGGLGESFGGLSSHLRSRQEVGQILRDSGVPVIEFRASIVIGSGSLSFEMIRALTERLPVMIAPRWVATLAQPIAIEDLVAYLMAAADVPGDSSNIYEIGGSDQVSYGDIMREYARQRGLRRVFIPVPVLTPRLSSLWLGLVTPLYARVGRKLIDSLRNQTIVHDSSALAVFKVRPCGISKAISRALCNEDREYAQTRWSDALSSAGPQQAWGGIRFGGRLVDSRVARVNQPPAVAFAPIRRIGGKTGWYYGTWLWQLRGFLDLLVSGVGMRRGRLDPEWPSIGGTLDFWRVEAFEPDRLLRLSAEMKVPGKAWLEFEVQGDASASTIRQTASFDPVGLSGLLYWYALFPLHHFIFAGMLRGIAETAEQEQERGNK